MSSDGGAVRPPPRSICLFGTYRRDHTATRLLEQACAAAAIAITECHEPVWEKTPHKHADYFGARSASRLAVEYAAAAVRLARRRRQLDDAPLYLVGFGGQFDCIWLRTLLRRRRPIVFAPLVSLTETLVDDRAVFSPDSLQARAVAAIDRWSLASADRVVIDTDAHRRYLIDTFGIPAERIAVWYLGTDMRVFSRQPLTAGAGPLRILSYSSFLPLHGTSIALRAAELLRDRNDIDWIFAGDGPEHAVAVNSARRAGLARVRFNPWLPYEGVPAAIAQADVCLGIFGTSAKAAMVIPNKIYEAAASGRPIITADTVAIREVFTPDENVCVCRAGDPESLAAAVTRLADDAALRQRLAEGAAQLMQERFAPRLQGERLAAVFAAAHAGR